MRDLFALTLGWLNGGDVGESKAWRVVAAACYTSGAHRAAVSVSGPVEATVYKTGPQRTEVAQ